MVRAEDTELIKGKLVSVDKAKRSIVVQDKNGVETTIFFEDDAAFSRIERLKIEIKTLADAFTRMKVSLMKAMDI